MNRTIELIGHITEDGELETKLPAGLPSGEVRVTIELPAETDEPDLTAEEVAELLRPEPPMSGAQIAAALESGELDTSAWWDVQDGASWVEEHRRQRRERRKW